MATDMRIEMLVVEVLTVVDHGVRGYTQLFLSDLNSFPFLRSRARTTC